MKIHRCEQGSDEWKQIKCGKASASHFADVLNKKTGRRAYMFKLLGERLSGESYESYSNKTMDRGYEVEAEARTYYEALYDVVEQVGFIELSDYIGCSPDGLVGIDGAIEIKCPQPNTHLTYIYNNRMPAVYIPQVQGNLWVSGRQWCDFISFDPRIEKRPFWKIRVHRDKEYIKTLAEEVQIFVREMIELEDKITNKNIKF